MTGSSRCKSSQRWRLISGSTQVHRSSSPTPNHLCCRVIYRGWKSKKKKKGKKKKRRERKKKKKRGGRGEIFVHSPVGKIRHPSSFERRDRNSMTYIRRRLLKHKRTLNLNFFALLFSGSAVLLLSIPSAQQPTSLTTRGYISM